MCGIAGKIYFQKEINKSEETPFIKDILTKLNHRGPDDRGYCLDNRAWLASARLSIIDLSEAGRMPLKNEDKSVWLVFNGEIYNYKDLRRRLIRNHHFVSKTDSEVVVHLYEEYGIDCLRHLRGMFAFAIWDKNKQCLFIARDRLGKKPVKYYFNSQFFIFASEIKSFIEHPLIPKEIDYEAIDEYLTMEYIPSPKTGFKRIYKLPPASYMLVNANGKISYKQYWELDYFQKIETSEEEWKKLVIEKLKESVKLRLQSDVPLGIHLSGGIDSSLITAIACQLSKKHLSTFSVGFEDDQYNELPYAKMVAKRYRTNHHEIVVKPQSLNYLGKLAFVYEEPFADPSILPTWFLMKESRKEITVALNGDGGDENFAGYERYRAIAIYKLIKSLPFKKETSFVLDFLSTLFREKNIEKLQRLLRFYENDYRYFYSNIINSSNLSLKESLYSAEFRNKVKNYKENFLVKRFSGLPKGLNWLDELLAIDIKTYLPDNLMVKIDMASMAHSLEVRSPFLDYEFMELTAKMPAGLKLKHFQTKYFLKKLAGQYLPKECICRRKQGFVPPLSQWLAEDRDNLKWELFSNSFLRLGMFNIKAVEGIIAKIAFLPDSYSRFLWRLLCLKNWHGIWFGQ